MSLYTTMNLAKRQQLRTDPRIEGWLSTYYTTFHADPDASSEIARDDVLNFELLVAKALFDSEDWDLELAIDAVKTDLDREIGPDAQTMAPSEFFHSLFETVDVWTQSVDLEEYLE